MRIEKKEIMTPRPSCFCCKSSLDIYRSKSNDGVIYFDKHYYHKECFKNMNVVKKKCYECKNDIDVFNTEDKEIVYYNKHFYHKNCFCEWCGATKNPSKKRQMALMNIETYINEAKDIVNNLLEKKNISDRNLYTYHNDAQKEIEKWFDGSDLCSFIREQYNVHNVPWEKISKIINGTSTNHGIPAKHLLDMWQRKMNMLNGIANRNVTKGKKMGIEQRIVYDLTILVNKYDSYLKWLEKQKILEAEKEIENNENIVGKSIGYISQKTEKNNSDDISDLVDDIFG